MDLDAWFSRHLVVPLEEDVSTWHWTGPREAEEIRRIVADRGDPSGFRGGAVGCGLYLSFSAVDAMERGPEPLRIVVRKGTRVLVADPRVFGVGVYEILVAETGRAPWVRWTPPHQWRAARQAVASDPPGAIEELLTRLSLPACLFVLGFHLAVMARDAGCLRIDGDVDPVASVLDYHERHPREFPTLAPHLLTAFVARHRGAYR